MDHLPLFDIGKYEDISPTKVGIAIKVVYKYRGKLLYAMPLKLVLSPFYSEYKERTLEEMEIAFREQKNKKYSTISQVKINKEYLYLGVNAIDDKNLNHYGGGYILDIADNYLLEDFPHALNIFFGTIPKEILEYNYEELVSVFFPIYSQMRKDWIFALNKAEKGITLGCSVEEFPNCVDHFVKRYEVDFDSVFPDENKLKELIFEYYNKNPKVYNYETFYQYLPRKRGHFLDYYLFKFSEFNTKDDLRDVSKFLYNFDSSFFCDFYAKEDMALIQFCFLDLSSKNEFPIFNFIYDKTAPFLKEYFCYVFEEEYFKKIIKEDLYDCN